jgi:hypothetical protein
MKMLVAIAGLALAAASPAFASSSHGHSKSHKSPATHVVKRHAIYAPLRVYVPGAPPYASYRHDPSYDVYVEGEYAGSDPDPRIRETIRKEWIEDRHTYH